MLERRNMFKRKFRTRRQYVGRRRNRNLSRAGKKDIDETDLGQHETEEARLKTKRTSASARKLEAFGFTTESLMQQANGNTETLSDSDCYFFVQMKSLDNLIGQLLCPNCEQTGIKFEVNQNQSQGFAIQCSLKCSICEGYQYEQFLCSRVGGTDSRRVPFEINILGTLAFRGIGCGYSAMKEWCNTMNMPYNISQNMYAKNHQKISEACGETFKEITKTSRIAIIDAYKEIGVEPDEEGVLDIGVSYDGSWHRRGHSSHNGMASVIELFTGLPIDYEVLSNFCLKCQTASDKPPKDLEEWKKKHSPNCPKNFDGSSNAMEVECALRIWKRSVENHKLRYTAMLCDGDSKAYDAVCQAKVYDTVEIQKEDCVNHVSKRMGTALRKLSAESKSQGSSISGRGKLTQVKLTKIQNYYGRAIKDHADDLELLKRRIFAILFHLSSSDDNPKHHHCPPGQDSWCFWQRAVAKSVEPGPHKDHETVPAEIGKRLVPIFMRLSKDDLLKRCSRKGTQNPNECLHNLIWRLCPKTQFAGRKTVETAALLSLCQFSMGASFKELLCQVLGIIPGKYFKEGVRQKNLKRISRADTASTDAVKKRRKHLKFKKTTQEQKTKNTEGETYAAGSFE